jgi:hypothetical protein
MQFNRWSDIDRGMDKESFDKELKELRVRDRVIFALFVALTFLFVAFGEVEVPGSPIEITADSKRP